MKKITFILSLGMFLLPFKVLSDDMISESPSNAQVYFIQPSDGQTVTENVKVVFGLNNMGVAPAGTDKKNTGHHHLLIDNKDLPDLTKPLPSTDNIKHFGGGQTETEIKLAPGNHTLQLLLGNFAHIPHNKPVLSEKITITVE
tara:strand:- start:6140 stop:6568 length:429 start_codon:yes stop_codon:yes gene_type:complete